MLNTIPYFRTMERLRKAREKVRIAENNGEHRSGFQKVMSNSSGGNSYVNFIRIKFQL